jgi:hypothetical protein
MCAVGCLQRWRGKKEENFCGEGLERKSSGRRQNFKPPFLHYFHFAADTSHTETEKHGRL